MADVQAGDRPVFDFGGALALAAEMWRMASSLEEDGKTRHTEWHVALEAWQGNVGNRFRGHIADDEDDLADVVKVLEAEALQWAALWADTVDETNRVLAAEARETLKYERSKADEGLQWHDADDWYDRDEKKRKESFDVPAAAPIDPPQPPSFGAPRSPFAQYELAGDEMIIGGYQDTVPPYAC